MKGRLSTPVAEMLSVSVAAPPPPASAGPADSSAHAVAPTSSADVATSAPMTLGNRDIKGASRRGLNIGYTIRRGVIWVNIYGDVGAQITAGHFQPGRHAQQRECTTHDRIPSEESAAPASRRGSAYSVTADGADPASTTPSAGVSARFNAGGAPGTALPGAGCARRSAASGRLTS